jgi:hypothetical protein
MSLRGIIFVNILSVGFLLLILNLVRTKKLNISYAVIWFLAVFGLMATVSTPLLMALPRLIGAQYPASALSLFAFVLIFLTLIFFSVQLSAISARQVELAQAIAIKGLLAKETAGETADPPSQS